jgi:hypothetical protein
MVAVVDDLMFNNKFPDRLIVKGDGTYTPVGGRVAVVAGGETGHEMSGPGGMPDRAWHMHHNDFVAASGNFALYRGKHIGVIFQRR